MTLHHGDCVDVMAAMQPESVDAIVTDPPYGLEFMGKGWDGADGFRRSLNAADVGRDNVFGRTSATSPEYRTSPMRRRPEVDAVNTGVAKQGGRQRQGTDYQRRQARDGRTYQEWCEAWASAAYRIAKPSAYLLSFGGTRTHHRLTAGIEDAGWEVRDCLVWGYASGFPKSKASLKPAWEPIVMARKPGPLRMLNIDECRIPSELEDGRSITFRSLAPGATVNRTGGWKKDELVTKEYPSGRWPANIVLTDPIFDGGWDGVVGGGETGPAGVAVRRNVGHSPGRFGFASGAADSDMRDDVTFGDSGTYSRFFLVPKADRTDREPVLRTDRELPFDEFNRNVGNTIARRRENSHPTVKPTDLMRHLVRLVTPTGGLVLDPFLGSGTTAVAAEMEGFAWVGIEREAKYVAIAEARLNGTQRGLGLGA